MKRSVISQFNRLVRRLKRQKHLKRYTYGWIINLDGTKRCRARIDSNTGLAEFVLWEVGQHGHRKKYWHRMGSGWHLQFEAYVV